MRIATHQTTPFPRRNFAGPMINSQGNTTKTMGLAALVASALLLAFGSSASLAAKPKSFEVEFDKCLDPSIVHRGTCLLSQARYLETFLVLSKLEL